MTPEMQLEYNSHITKYTHPCDVCFWSPDMC